MAIQQDTLAPAARRPWLPAAMAGASGVVVVGLLVLLWFGLLQKEVASSKVVNVPFSTAPDFSLGLFDGSTFTLSQALQTGKPVVVNFWASWCGPCADEAPLLQDAARRNAEVGNEGIALFEISRIFLPSGEARPREELHAGGIVKGGFARAKGAVELVHDVLGLELDVERTQEPWLHPGKAARTGGGWLGELHPALLEGSWGNFRKHSDASYLASLKSDFGARMGRLGSLGQAERQMLASAPRAAHHIWTNLPDPGHGAFAERSCSDKYRWMAHRPVATATGEAAASRRRPIRGAAASRDGHRNTTSTGTA